MRTLLFTVLLAVTAIGCARAPYKQVLSERPVTNYRDYAAPKDLVYQAALRTVYARNYVLETEDPETGVFLGKRMVQRGKQTFCILLQVKVVDNFDNTTRLFLNGVQTTEICYVADKTRFFLFVIPLPGGGGKEVTSTRREEQYINDQTFYKEIFNDVSQSVAELKNASPIDFPMPMGTQEPTTSPEG